MPTLTFPVAELPEPTWAGAVTYAFLRERDTWSRMDAKDYLSPLVNDRPAVPGGPPYWGRLARLAPLERVLVQFEEMLERLAALGLDVGRERAELAELRRQAQDPAAAASDALFLAARQAKRRLFFRDPRLAPLERVLFAKHHPLQPSHNYSEHLDSLFAPGGGICVLHVPRDADGRLNPARAEVETLFDGSAGIVRHPVADFDAQTIYFAYRPDKPEVDGWQSYWHLMSMRADGSGLRQLTEGPFHDFDPVPLPDGGLGFMSTRCQARFLCWEPQAYVLYRMQPDGSGLRRLSYANLSEWDPSRDARRADSLDPVGVPGQGRRLRPHALGDPPRWRPPRAGLRQRHALLLRPWARGARQPGTRLHAHLARRPPGTDRADRPRPGTVRHRGHHQHHARHPAAVPDGPVAPRDLPRSRADLARSFPGQPQSRPADRTGACMSSTVIGNRELLYLDPAISSKRPSLLRAGPRPPVLPETRDPVLAQQGLGQFTVQDVYEGLGSTVARGQAKYLQVSQEVPAPLERLADGEYRSSHPSFQDFYATPDSPGDRPAPQLRDLAPPTRCSRMPSGPAAPPRPRTEPRRSPRTHGWPSYVAKAVLGTVRIADDGSANFTAPAGKVLYFHLLDENFNELQRMRSVVQLQPGEQRSCVGCHDARSAAPLAPGGPGPRRAGPSARAATVGRRRLRLRARRPARPGRELRPLPRHAVGRPSSICGAPATPSACPPPTAR